MSRIRILPEAVANKIAAGEVVERHATSKLRTADDLLSIATLGFRGEALPSLAAVARLLLETRAEEDAEGTRIEFAGGKLLGVKPAGLPVGTAVSVADLFYCVPARRNFSSRTPPSWGTSLRW